MLKYGADTNKFGFTAVMIHIFIHWWSPYALPKRQFFDQAKYT
jgi:hypothetical protein